MEHDQTPALSIVVPVLNEEATLPALFATLSRQRCVDFELILCDGGSQDRTWELCRQTVTACNFPVRCLQTAPGRACQMNAGARAAAGALLLFLHADSQFLSPLALADGVAAWQEGRRHWGEALAGHFRLVFDGPGSRQPGYRFYTRKARSGRRGTIHGDQGFLLSAEWFQQLGGYPEDLSLLEDTRLADRILQQGHWLLLPAEILTSTRRFEQEGLLARQVLNALVMNFAAIGWNPFFAEARGLYRQQSAAGPLDLGPFFALITRLLRERPRSERRWLWTQTGAYVRSQGWQLGLVLDCRRHHRAGDTSETGAGTWEARFDRWFERLSDNWAGRGLATLLVFSWFHLARRHLTRRSQRREL